MMNIEVRGAGKKGRGVFALSDIAKGAIIERCPVIVLSPEDCKKIDPTELYNYYFGWGEDDKSAAIALGFGSIYNHSYQPNAVYEKELETREIVFRALRSIQAGEEILTNYNGDPSSQSPVWFDAQILVK
jgi:hypothetical protein